MKAFAHISATLEPVWKEATRKLASHGIERPRWEAGLLLAHVLGVEEEHLFTHPDQELSASQEERFLQLIERRCRREPWAYLTGHREFWSLEFEVNPKVLIPRPETEGVIERLKNLAGNRVDRSTLHILDVGTGSGILAIVAALEFPRARVTAVDKSPEALEIAQHNAARHRVLDRIEFLQMDLKDAWNLPETSGYDFILSNPPYIPSGQWQQLMPEVRDYEPRAALDGGPDGLACYRCIVEKAVPFLKPAGYLILEVGDNQARPLKQMLQIGGRWEAVDIIPDLSGRDRVVSARRALG